VPVCGKCGKIKGFPQQTGIGSKFGGAEYWLNLWWLNVVAGLVSAEVVVSAELAVSCGSRNRGRENSRAGKWWRTESICAAGI
jgi:hypothetical protein